MHVTNPGFSLSSLTSGSQLIITVVVNYCSAFAELLLTESLYKVIEHHSI